MNTAPQLRWKWGDYAPPEAINPGCGRLALELTERAWWQSRAALRDPPELTDLHALARKVRRTFHQEQTP